MEIELRKLLDTRLNYPIGSEEERQYKAEAIRIGKSIPDEGFSESSLNAY